jgi:hypothetical protein
MCAQVAKTANVRSRRSRKSRDHAKIPSLGKVSCSRHGNRRAGAIGPSATFCKAHKPESIRTTHQCGWPLLCIPIVIDSYNLFRSRNAHTGDRPQRAAHPRSNRRTMLRRGRRGDYEPEQPRRVSLRLSAISATLVMPAARRDPAAASRASDLSPQIPAPIAYREVSLPADSPPRRRPNSSRWVRFLPGARFAVAIEAFAVGRLVAVVGQADFPPVSTRPSPGYWPVGIRSPRGFDWLGGRTRSERAQSPMQSAWLRSRICPGTDRIEAGARSGESDLSWLVSLQRGPASTFPRSQRSIAKAPSRRRSPTRATEPQIAQAS